MVPQADPLGIEMPKVKREKLDCADLFSKVGARLLAAVIVKYWHDRGHFVFAEGYPMTDVSIAGKWGVRSNLVNGLPPKHLLLRV
jgi:hypothetical protein